MIRIAVVDDDKNMLEMIKKNLMSVKGILDDIQVDTFDETDEFWKKTDDTKYDILFSDIEMPVNDGITFATRVKEKLPEIILVFLTAYEKYAARSYLVKAYQYILKEDMNIRLPNVLKEAIEQLCNERKQYRVIRVNNDFVKIFYKDVIYFKKKKSAKYVEFYTTSGEYKERTTLEKVIQDINENTFVIVERGYVVNIRHIERMKSNTIYLDNGEKMNISRARASAVKDKIHGFFGGE